MASAKVFNRELIAVAVLLVSVSVPALGQSAPITPQAGQGPIAISREEAASHRAGRQPILRIQLDARMAAELAMEGVTVKVVVRPDGVVTSTKATHEDAPPSLLGQAESKKFALGSVFTFGNAGFRYRTSQVTKNWAVHFIY